MEDGHLNKELFRKVFHDHIAKDIEWAINEKRDLVAAQLLLTAIDVTAGLCRPVYQEDTSRTQFLEWSNKYLTLQGRYYRLTGMDLYGTRCGLLHGYTPEARVVRTGEDKVLAYLDDASEPLFTDLTPKLVIVSLRHLFPAYITGLVETM